MIINLSPLEEEKYLVKNGDLLFNRTNSRDLVGKTAVFRGASPMAFADYLVRGRCNENGHAEYISAFMNSVYGKAKLRHMCKNIVGMANINAQEFQDIPICLPPYTLQFKFAEVVKKVILENRKKKNHSAFADNLFNSLVQKAFKGELHK